MLPSLLLLFKCCCPNLLYVAAILAAAAISIPHPFGKSAMCTTLAVHCKVLTNCVPLMLSHKLSGAYIKIDSWAKLEEAATFLNALIRASALGTRRHHKALKERGHSRNKVRQLQGTRGQCFFLPGKL
jgi:hypothetical protein